MHHDGRDMRDPVARELDLFTRLPEIVARALTTQGWREHLGAVDAASIRSREALAPLPVLRKSDLSALQKSRPPFADLMAQPLNLFGRLFTSPGPIYEPEGTGADPWRAARALSAAGFRRGDVIVNTFSYHLTPGGFIMDSAARAIGCPVIPAGPGNTEQTLDVVQHLKPVGYCGTPDFLKIMLDKARETGRDASSITRALVSGAAFPPSLQAEIKARGVDAYQAYATADVGLIAYETKARDGLVVNEDVILEIVRPGTGDPVAPGEVGEIVVTTLDPHHPVIRLALGDLTQALAGVSACGRTNMRIRGWMGRADQTAKVKGMFVRPEQVAEIGRRHPELARLRLVVSRANEQDQMLLRAETSSSSDDLARSIGDSVIAVTKLKAAIDLVAPGSLPNDGKVIADERPVG
ncbi:MAG: AMP-binding protein [Rhizobiales bacterium]|nr:AMP-binding protein [Hyphomicrobiales bacterium]